MRQPVLLFYSQERNGLAQKQQTGALEAQFN